MTIFTYFINNINDLTWNHLICLLAPNIWDLFQAVN